eukprot:GHVS01036548.1.p1 GENE.GHVS01036548.1~~GHVS01036548.1.p1  ORF type:complete len:608 (+),score=74.55 GHVS01036548.1:185-2008(+)
MKLYRCYWLFGLLLVAVGTEAAEKWKAGGGFVEFMDEHSTFPNDLVKIYLETDLKSVNGRLPITMKLLSELNASKPGGGAAQGQVQPAGAQPAVAQPAVAQPAVAQPAGAQPAGAQPAGATIAAARDAVEYGEYGFSDVLYRENGTTAVFYNDVTKEMHIFSGAVPDLSFNHILAATGGRYVLETPRQTQMLQRLPGIGVFIKHGDVALVKQTIGATNEIEWLKKVTHLVTYRRIYNIVEPDPADNVVSFEVGAFTRGDATWVDKDGEKHYDAPFYSMRYANNRCVVTAEAVNDFDMNVFESVKGKTNGPTEQFRYGKGCGMFGMDHLTKRDEILAELAQDDAVQEMGSVFERGKTLAALLADDKKDRSDIVNKTIADKNETDLIEKLMKTPNEGYAKWLGGGLFLLPADGKCPDWPTIQLEGPNCDSVLKVANSARKQALFQPLGDKYEEQFSDGSLLKSDGKTAMFYDETNKVLHISTAFVPYVQNFTRILKRTKGAYKLQKKPDQMGLSTLSGFTLCVSTDIQAYVKGIIPDDNGMNWTSTFQTENGGFSIDNTVGGLVAAITSRQDIYRPQTQDVGKWKEGRYDAAEFRINANSVRLYNQFRL